MHPPSAHVQCRVAVVILSLLATAHVRAGPSLPAIGSHGFDWLHPTTTQCKTIGAKDIASYGSCSQSAIGFGGGYTPTHVCRGPNGSEWIIYATREACQTEFETMQANAP